MVEYKRVVSKEAQPLFERVIARMAMETPGSVELTAVEPSGEPDSVELVIGYRHETDLFVLGFKISLEEARRPTQAHYTIRGVWHLAWTRHGQAIPLGEQLFVIWKRGCITGEYKGGWGYAGHIPTDKASAEWYAESTTERLKQLYHWEKDVVFEVLPYKPCP